MRILGRLILLLGLPPPGRAQVSVIFDTDMDTDCDDAGALAVLRAPADSGEVAILATVAAVIGEPLLPATEGAEDSCNVPAGVARVKG